MMGFRLSLAVLVVIATGCGASNPGLGISSPASSARMSPSTPSPAVATCEPPKACPSQLPVGGLAFDAERQTLVVFGGYSPDARSVLNETWEWNAVTGGSSSTRQPFPPRGA